MKKIISLFFVIFICTEMTAETKRGPLFLNLLMERDSII
ncbi:hypothetical protein LEP1GSC150_5561 [Leptospira interrogans serovar Copenhageni str. LT2050]|uniref:Uncharacterized protein n=1 Tax=Leptospira interrogans serovar Copenhageni str. LT2050 TaxID=1001598 RepID=M3H7W2_LEPIT|nr:hypothetical protein LEP1GSC150_5561 [Leptospira interrogans serovar Copenhageni str. LT2050]